MISSKLGIDNEQPHAVREDQILSKIDKLQSESSRLPCPACQEHEDFLITLCKVFAIQGGLAGLSKIVEYYKLTQSEKPGGKSERHSESPRRDENSGNATMEQVAGFGGADSVEGTEQPTAGKDQKEGNEALTEKKLDHLEAQLDNEKRSDWFGSAEEDSNLLGGSQRPSSIMNMSNNVLKDTGTKSFKDLSLALAESDPAKEPSNGHSPSPPRSRAQTGEPDAGSRGDTENQALKEKAVSVVGKSEALMLGCDEEIKEEDAEESREEDARGAGEQQQAQGEAQLAEH